MKLKAKKCIIPNLIYCSGINKYVDKLIRKAIVHNTTLIFTYFFIIFFPYFISAKKKDIQAIKINIIAEVIHIIYQKDSEKFIV